MGSFLITTHAVHGVRIGHAIVMRCGVPSRRRHACLCVANIGAMVPLNEQQKLLGHFQEEQSYTMDVSRSWLLQSMRCKLIVAEQENIPFDLLASYRYQIQKAKEGIR